MMAVCPSLCVIIDCSNTQSCPTLALRRCCAGVYLWLLSHPPCSCHVCQLRAAVVVEVLYCAAVAADATRYQPCVCWWCLWVSVLCVGWLQATVFP